MAKKPISKHSRAARRSEAAEPEAKALETLPRTEKTDFAASLIRTANKNEQLLEAKLNKRGPRNKKKSLGRVGKQQLDDSSLTSSKVMRVLNVNNRLDGKRERAIHRAKYVQSARKAGWDSTNAKIRDELNILQNIQPVSEEKDQADNQDNGKETGDEQSMDDNEVEVYDSAKVQQSTELPVQPSNVNTFASLEDEVEA
ncbi:Ecm1p [Kluyveromyces lactis]|uniref:KLLA0F00484p n=1 Tax=Kluyveromyces lactis (strain ATCC 8585 / CBS 2359 / DSM 70799 / NBRC 1267 / NRRL Y-1140 / WM37) TaxID=284590 RepID=Q6CLT8_KLULA|nr:uncharacterized protein KLLA0_F00484g [Kluyveromyces lactis]CAG97808.1 KLLA0F00484p [Kluyveromyces lactis]|eukprot:XP_455101.1 uncharacterized protein KLLA0_F00484g [Kluyveromyces lactis]